MSFSIKKTILGVLLVLSCTNLHAMNSGINHIPHLAQQPAPQAPQQAQALQQAPQPVPAPLWQDIFSTLYNTAKNQRGWVPLVAGFMAGPLALRLVADRSSTAETLKAVLCPFVCYAVAPLMAGKRPSTDTLPHGALANIGLVAGILTLPTVIKVIKYWM